MDEKTRARIKQYSREIADEMARLLHQEYKWHEGQWWLFTLGLPARPLRAAEIEYAKERGLIPQDKKE